MGWIKNIKIHLAKTLKYNDKLDVKCEFVTNHPMYIINLIFFLLFKIKKTRKINYF